MVKAGEVLATLYTSEECRLASAKKRYLDSLTWSKEAPEEQPLVYDIVEE